MTPMLKSNTQTTQRFTLEQRSSAHLDERLLVGKTKRYTFYWVGEDDPVLVLVRDIDGTEVTEEIDPPDGMRRAVRNASG
jgi:hypothetical protein